jgi:hypothetical protein
MSTPATGDNTPAAKRLKMTANAVTPPRTITPSDLALAIARFHADADEAAEAAEAEAEANEDAKMDDSEPTAPAGPEPAPLSCSLTSLPSAFTSFSMTIAKKVTTLLMTKRAKLRVMTKLDQRETVPNSIRFKFELTGSNEVTGNSDFHDLSAAAGMALLTCQQELKSYMRAVAQMEIDVVNTKYRAIFHQTLKGYAQLLLINKGTSARPPTDAQTRELALTTLEHNIEHLTKEHNFHFVADSIFTDYKVATDDTLTPWTFGTACPIYVAENAQNIAIITGLLFNTFITRWMDKVREFQEKEKATLLQNAQHAFFKTAATKAAAEALAAEQSMDETKMDSVISNKIANEAKSVRALLTKLEEMIRRTTISEAKNSERGAANHRASKPKTNANKPSKTKTSTTPNRRPPKSKSDAAAAAAAANATSGKDKNKSKQKQQRRRTGKKDNNETKTKR